MSNSEPQAQAQSQAEAPGDREFLGVPPYPDLPVIEALAPSIESRGRRQFLRKWGVHPDFVPFAGLHTSPIDVVAAVRSAIENKPPTASTIRMTNVADELGYDNASSLSNVPIRHIVYYFGGWEHPDELTSNTRCRRWVNPGHKFDRETKEALGPIGHYADLRSDGPGCHMSDDIRVAREEWITLGCAYRLENTQIARRLGDVDPKTVTTLARKAGIDSGGLRESATVMFARTWKTAQSWGVPTAEIAEAAGYTPSGLRAVISHHASEFEPPADPSISGTNTNIY